MNPFPIWLRIATARWKRGASFQGNSDRAGWIIAWALALVLHAGGILVLYSLPLVAQGSAEVPKPVMVRLFKESAPETRGKEEPHFFSELPPDRADKAPKKPDFLSNVTSRARDLVPGGNANLPRMEGEGDAPTVRLEPNGSPSAALSLPAPQLKQTPIPRSAESQGGPQQERQRKTAEGTISLSKPIEPDVPRQASNDALQGDAGSVAGGSDIHQPEMDQPDGNAELTGDVSLNTTAWDYAPWLQLFGRKLMRWWFAPPAYYMGLLKEGGWALFQVEVARSGKVLHLVLLEQQGHPSLIRNAQSALANVSPLEPLPADFPESTLVLRVRMTYPRARPR